MIAVIVKLVDSTGWRVVLAVLVAITILAGFIKRVATVYTITDRRLNIKIGIVARKVQETRLQRVQNVNYNQGVYERIMQIGDVEFTTAGTEESNFIFAGVAQPEHVVAQVEQATPIVAGLQGEAERLLTASASARTSRGLRRRPACRPRPAASRSCSARSVRSQVKSASSRPKWP